MNIYINTKEGKTIDSMKTNNLLFITYQIKDNSQFNNYFECSKCSKTFNSFYNLKRHYLQVELNIKEKCKCCGNNFKRIDEHMQHCKSLINSNKTFINNNKIEKDLFHPSLSIEFEPNNIIKKIIPDLLLKTKNCKIDNRFIYFPDYIIGKGAYGTVIFGINLENNLPVAIKVQKRENNIDMLEKEKKIMEIIPKDLPFPKIYYKNINEVGNIIIESLCGPSLNKLYNFCNNKFDIITVSNIAIDIISSLEILHNTGYLHLDIKDDNIVILLQDFKKAKDQISCILIDFGKSFKLEDNNYKYKKSNLKNIGGNYRYASINILKNGIPNKKDDLESLLYLLLELYYGELPWTKIEKNNHKNYKKELLIAKELFNIDDFCDNTFNELKEAFKLIYKLDFKEKQDYVNLKSLFIKAINKNGGPNVKRQFRFKWENLFYYIVKEFFQNQNLDEFLSVIDIIFKGFPEKFVIEYLKQYYYSNY